MGKLYKSNGMLLIADSDYLSQDTNLSFRVVYVRNRKHNYCIWSDVSQDSMLISIVVMYELF